MGKRQGSPWVKINPPVFFGATFLTLAFVGIAIISPEATEALFDQIQRWIVYTAGWFYVLAVAGFLLFIVYLAISSYGLIKLGPDHSTPDYSYTSWFAMLFSAGMGIGLLFFGVAEPVMHYLNPPTGTGETVSAAREALRITFFHWGVHAWAIYGVVALALAYFSFRHNLPLAIRSSFYPLIGERIYGPIGHAADIFAVIGTIFGVATSLGFGVLQIGSGLNFLLGLNNTITLQIVLIALITLIAIGSVATGLDGGIRRISELNMILAVVLLLFVLITGPTIFLLQAFVQNTGYYASHIVNSTFNLYAYQQQDWIGGWTLFYWGWWIAWSPFVGMFIARVSRGRTIREFVTGVLLVPVGFTFLWMTFFGNTAIHMIMVRGYAHLGEAVQADTTTALFYFFHQLPLSNVSATLATILVVTFFVTSSDSGSLVIDMLTNGGETESPVWQRVFWAVIAGIVAIALLITGGLTALQTAAIASALPFTIVMVLICWGLFRALNIEIVKKRSFKEAVLMPKTNTETQSWESRLTAILRNPRKPDVLKFVQDVVKPAMLEVSEALKRKNVHAIVEQGKDGRVWIEVSHGDEDNFFYSVRPNPYTPPSFALRSTLPQEEDKYSSI